MSPTDWHFRGTCLSLFKHFFPLSMQWLMGKNRETLDLFNITYDNSDANEFCLANLNLDFI